MWRIVPIRQSRNCTGTPEYIKFVWLFCCKWPLHLLVTLSCDTLESSPEAAVDEDIACAQAEPVLVIDDDAEDRTSTPRDDDTVEGSNFGEEDDPTDSQFLAAGLLLSQGMKWVLQAKSLFENHDTDFDSTGIFYGKCFFG